MDFNWIRFKVALGSFSLFVGIILGILYLSNVKKIDYRRIVFLAVGFAVYEYVVCAGWVSGGFQHAFLVGVVLSIFYGFYLNNKNN